jgi:UDP-hydrolysing UDP-N-acetyl-D-glucosamine 2-epimerase
MKKRIIGIFTGNRAEYGLMLPIIKAIKKHPKLTYKLIVSGAHLERNFGETIEEIYKDGFKIYSKIPIKSKMSKKVFTAKSIGQIILRLTTVLQKLKPDIFLTFADRFESFAAVTTSTQMNIPTAHVEGGDITEGGALDDSVRHAMTKLSHFHFTTNQESSNRIIAMGEEKWRVKMIGFPAIDLLKLGNFAKHEELRKKFNIDIKKPIIIFTQHSVTTEYLKTKKQLTPSLDALIKASNEGCQVIVTYPNNDVGGEVIKECLKKILIKKNSSIKIIKSLGRYNYHGVLALAKKKSNMIVCVGNSSSGIKETPFFGCPTVNIGSRQKGRLRANNVIDVNYNKSEIYSAIKKCLHNENFRKKCRNVKNPYKGGNAGKLIAMNLANMKLNLGLILKKKMTIRSQINGKFFG